MYSCFTLSTYTITELDSTILKPMSNTLVIPSPIIILDCNAAEPGLVVVNTFMLKLSKTCPGKFSSGEGTWSGVINLSPSITISSGVKPVAVTYAPPILDKEPPLILVSNKFTSVIVTEPSLSNFLKINVSPTDTLT